MTYMHQTRPLAAPKIPALFAWVPKLRRGMKSLFTPPVYLSPHMARDIGFEPGSGPVARIELPSQVWAHPRL